MRVLLVGAGGVGTAFARTAARRNAFEHIVIADHDQGPGRAGGAVRQRPLHRRRARRLRREGGRRAAATPSVATCS